MNKINNRTCLQVRFKSGVLHGVVFYVIPLEMKETEDEKTLTDAHRYWSQRRQRGGAGGREELVIDGPIEMGQVGQNQTGRWAWIGAGALDWVRIARVGVAQSDEAVGTSGCRAVQSLG
eukprot:SAG11_NODE_1206_length_5528_cov_20.313502_3_plen_119_part_00